MDQLILSRVRAVLDDRFGSGVGTLGGLDAAVSAGKVTLTGATTDQQTIVDAVRATQSVEGVTGVESQVNFVEFRTTNV